MSEFFVGDVGRCGSDRWQIGVRQDIGLTLKKMTVSKKEAPTKEEAFRILQERVKILMNDGVVEQRPIELKLREFDYRLIPCSMIIDSPIEPEERLTQTAVRGLRECVLESRVIAPLMVAATRRGKYMCLDGHRRKTVAMSLGLEAIWCVIVKGIDAEELLALLNKGVRHFKGNTWLTIYAKSDDPDGILDLIPPPFRAQIQGLVEIMGHAAVVKLGLEGIQAPVIVRPIATLCAVFRDYSLEGVDKKRVAAWVIDHKASRLVNELNRNMNRRKAEKLHWCIVNNKNHNERRSTANVTTLKAVR